MSDLDIKEVCDIFYKWYATRINDDLALKILESDPDLYNDVFKYGASDTDIREHLIDAFTKNILGMSLLWPTNGNYSKLKYAFYKKYIERCESQNIQVDIKI